MSNQCSPQTRYLEEDLEKIGKEEVTRRMRFLQKSKEHLRKRFVKEYLHALEERQRPPTGNIAEIPNTGALVLLVEACTSGRKGHGQGWNSPRIEA